MKEALVKINPFCGLIILIFFGLMGNDLSAQECFDSYTMRDSVDFTIGLGSCEVSEQAILQEIGLGACDGDVSLSVSGVGLNQSRIVDLIDEESNAIIDNFVVTVSGAVNSIPSNIILEVSPFDCNLDKNYVLSRIGIDTSESSITSTIHFISGTTRVSQFPVGDTTHIDRIVCGDGYVFATDIKVYLYPDHILPNSTTINYPVAYTTQLFTIEEVLTNSDFRYIDACSIDRLTISNSGPFGYGLSTIGDVYLDDALIAPNLRVNITAPSCPTSLLDMPIPADQCFVNKNDILDTLGFNPAIDDYTMIDVTLSNGDSYDNPMFTVESISVRGVVICNQPIHVSYTRPTDILLLPDNFACNDVLNISLDDACSIELNSDVLLENVGLCFLNFIVTAEDDQGIIIAQDHSITLTKPGSYKVTVSDPRSSLSCWSTVNIEDKYIYDVVCPADTVACQYGLEPMLDTATNHLHFPYVGISSTYQQIGINEYNIINSDECGIKYGSYQDIISERCTGEFQEVIDRHWTFLDDVGNEDTCIQRIYVLKTSLDSIDSFEQFQTDCLSDFDQFDDNGHPVPAEVGYPTIGNGRWPADVCGVLKKTYSDNVFELCGRSKKIIREWLIIDWCNDNILTKNQTILIEDQEPPVLVDSLPDVALNTHPFLCGAENIVLPEPNITDCGSDDIDLQILYETIDAFGNKVIRSNGSSLTIPSIDMSMIQDQFIVEYIFTDECDNVLRDTIIVDIEDNQPPVAVCDQNTAISIAGNGQAQVRALTFDDLSVDNCGIAKYEARKLDGACNVDGEFSELILFCCEEVGQTITIEFRVTDIAGNFNTCKVYVEIFDKFIPIIACPDDITIDCAEDYTDLTVTGSANAIDNCSVDSLYYTDQKNLDECGKGLIVRTWTAIDRGEQMVSCEQFITVDSDVPFEMTTDRFPMDTSIVGCLSTVDPLFTGEPDLDDASCAQVVATYEDTYFNDIQNGCFKIIRQWIVIDWCQYSTAMPENGYWTMAQAIKVENELAPEFVDLPSDTTLCLNGNDCVDFFNLMASAVDDCSDIDELDWFYQVRTTGDNPQTLKTSTSNVMSAQLSEGTYEVTFTVADGCDNFSSQDVIITIVDCEAPIIDCPNVEGSAVLDQNGQALVFISDFDFDISDNCSSVDELNVSFSPDADINTLVFTCQDISNGVSDSRLVTLYVRDAAGNLNQCEAPLEIFDSSADYCEDIEVEDTTATVTGQIFTEELVGTDNVVVTLREGSLATGQSLTDVSGTFSFDDLKANREYSLSLERDSRYDDGLTTLDLLLIQRHILGLGLLDSPYKIIAGDVDNNGRITGGDLVKMRRIILGIDNDFGSVQSNWKFLPAAYEFSNPYLPFPYPETIDIQTNQIKPQSVEIISVKIGDVNGTNEVSSRFKANGRSSSKHVLTIGQAIQDGDESLYDVPVYSDVDELSGLQFSIDMVSPQSSFVSIWSDQIEMTEANFNAEKDRLRFSWNDDNGSLAVDTDRPLFYVRIRSTESLEEFFERSTDGMASLSITSNLEEQEVLIIHSDKPTIIHAPSEISNVSISPNPFSDIANITMELSKGQEVRWSLITPDGKYISQDSKTLSSGTNSIAIDISDIEYQGMLFLQISTSVNQTITRRIVRIAK